MMINEVLIILMFVFFLGGVMSGFPIAWVLAGSGGFFAGLGWLSDIYLGSMTGLGFQSLGLLPNRIWGVMSNWVLVALPMFIFMGIMLEKSDVARTLMLSLQRALGRARGGLALSVLVIGVLLAASTGIIGASVVLLGLLSLPSMLANNYDKRLAAGLVCGTGCLGILIPPSIMLIIMADQLTLPVGDVFMGAVFPGLILASLYAFFIGALAFFKPELFPQKQAPEAWTWELTWELSKAILPPIVLIIAVLGSIFAGWATPTDASGIGALGATLLAWRSGKLNKTVWKEVLESTLVTNAFIFAIIIGATCFSLVLRELGGDEFIESLLTGLPGGNTFLLWTVLGVVFFLGFFLDWIEITLIMLPLVGPVLAGLDFGAHGYGVVDQPNLLWFAVLVALTLQTSFLTPPVGFALFYLKGVAPEGISLKDIYRGVVPFICLQLLALLIVYFFPQLVTWLPAVTYR